MHEGAVGFAEREQFRMIEIFAQWEGRVNATNLQTLLKIGRNKAYDILNRYQALTPENLEYDASLKGFKPSSLFHPHVASGHIDEYSQLLSRSGDVGYMSVFETGFCQLEAPLRNVSATLVQPIIRAIRDRLRVDIGYTSLSSPDYESRIISPHCLVFDGIRWHVRAYCEKNRDYRDFVLSRFNGEAAFEGTAQFGADQDTRWNTWLELVIAPDPRLSPENRRLIELDYQMENGQRIIPVRAALVLYMMKRLHLDHYSNQPEAQQIIITPESDKAIRPYLP